MDFVKMMRTYIAVQALISMVRQAISDNRLTAAEIYTIVIGGLGPLLELYGIRLPLESSPELQALQADAKARVSAMEAMFQ